MILPEELTSQLESFNLCMYVCMHICIYVCVHYSGGRRSQGLACVASAHLYPEPSAVLRQDFTMRPWLNLNS